MPSQSYSSTTFSPGESVSGSSHCLVGMVGVIEVVVRVVN